MERYIIFDCETDGNGTFNPPTQNIVQLSWIVVELKEDDEHYKMQIVKERDRFLKDTTTEIKWDGHGITIEKLKKDGKKTSKVLARFASDFNKCDVAIAHNINFDMGCIKRLIKLKNLDIRLSKKVIQFDTMKNIKIQKHVNLYIDTKYGRKLKWPKLIELSEKCELDCSIFTFHNSLEDCKALLGCLRYLVKKNIISLRKNTTNEIHNLTNSISRINIHI